MGGRGQNSEQTILALRATNGRDGEGRILINGGHHADLPIPVARTVLDDAETIDPYIGHAQTPRDGHCILHHLGQRRHLETHRLVSERYMLDCFAPPVAEADITGPHRAVAARHQPDGIVVNLQNTVPHKTVFFPSASRV